MTYPTVKFILALVLALSCAPALFAQRPTDTPPVSQTQRPTTDDFVYEVKQALGLSGKDLDKVCSAYKKYSRTVFGNNDLMSDIPQSSGNRPDGARPMGGPAGGRPGGGMGPGGPGRNGGPGAPGGVHGVGSDMPSPGNGHQDMAKFVKTRTKAEEKLCKSMKKIFKNAPGQYDKWLSIRSRQLDRLFPPMPVKPGPSSR